MEAGRALEEYISLLFKSELHIFTGQEKRRQVLLSLLLLKRAWGIYSGKRLKEQIVPAQPSAALGFTLDHPKSAPKAGKELL